MAKTKIEEQIEIPEGISCEIVNDVLKCKKDSLELSRAMDLIGVGVKIDGNKVILSAKRDSKRELKVIKTNNAHILNIFNGLQEKFTYKLEVANVHFPMTLKVEGDKLIINNFLGEKVPRHANILPNVDVDIKGKEITVSSADREAAGQTSANLEKATKVKGRDKRVFQDGIYITEKPGRRE